MSARDELGTILDGWLAGALAVDLAEAHNDTRTAVRKRISDLRRALDLIPDIETDAVVALGYSRDDALRLLGGAMAPA